jgi:hypothetical protein
MNQSIELYENWSSTRKITFRYVSIFFFLFILPFPLTQIPWVSNNLLSSLFQAYADLWNTMINYAGSTLFGFADGVSSQATGSGDKAYDWIQIFLSICITLVAGTIWSILDRKRKSYSRLWRWFYLLLTYTLAYWMFVYGIIKVFGGQFSAPPLSRLLETFGESSPMRIMWTFMGASETYVHFCGWSETIAGTLLLFRRTRTIGGLAAAGVMLNVFMMNMSYDVPVKLFSFTLMLAGLYIALVDGRRLLNVFLLNKPAPALEWKPMFETQWKNYLLMAIQFMVIGNILYSMLVGRLGTSTSSERPEIYGIHDVDTFILNGDTLAPLLTDQKRWKKVFVDVPFYGRQTFGIKMMNDQVIQYTANLDEEKDLITLTIPSDTLQIHQLHYEFDGSQIVLNGVILGDSIQAVGSYFNPDDFIIRSRGFNWINEVPYNRNVPYKN